MIRSSTGLVLRTVKATRFQLFCRDFGAAAASSSSTSAVPFKLADIGEGIAEVELIKWFVKKGDAIKSFDKLCEVQSDKANVEITSRYDGIISAVHYKEGDIVKVGDALVDILPSAGSAAQLSSAKPASSSAPPKPAAAAPTAAPATKAVSTTTTSSATSGIPFKLADIGEGIAEVELVKWFVKKGDPVKSFDKICEVQSDKANVEITSRYDGIISAVHYKEGDIVKVGDALVDIVPHGSAAGKESSGKSASAVTPAATTATVSSSSREARVPPEEFIPGTNRKVLTTPAVRRIAKENSLNLAQVSGTGPKGRILKEDVLRFLRDGPSATRTTTTTTPTASIEVPTATVVSVTPSQGDRVVPIRGLARTMVKSMTASLQVPHMTYSEEIIFDNLVKLREALNAEASRRNKMSGATPIPKLSYLPIILKATSLALLRFPQLNATISSDATSLTHHANHNISIAVDSPKGLLVPVVREIQKKSVFEIAADLAVLQEAAAKGTLSEAQMTGGTFSLSNIGSIGGVHAVPVIVVPQLVIGAIGRVQTVPRYVDPVSHQPFVGGAKEIFQGKAVVAPVSVMNVSWSADHRVVDGATVARFSNLWKAYLENPFTMLSDMK